jgi:Putative restriction endonuclease
MSTIATKQAEPSLPSIRMTVEEFEKTDFYNDKRLELLDGYIVRRGEMNPPHAVITGRLRRRINRMLPADWCTREDKPVQIPPLYEPLPDIAIVRGEDEKYIDHHPGPADIAALIEVSDATLSKDQGKKLAAYALNGIAVYWIVNLVDHQVELYTEPNADAYGSKLVFTVGQSVPVIIDGAVVGHLAVSDILS